MTISDQAPPLELQPTRHRPGFRRAGRLPAPRLASLQVDPEALVFGGGRVRVRALIERPDERLVRLWVQLAGRDYEVPVSGCTAETEIELADVDWWWPIAHGQPARHPIQASLLGPDAEVLDTVHRRIGFRWAQWAIEPDQSGNPCILVVNGQRVAVRGVDWTCEPSPERVTRQAFEERLTALCRAGINLLRVRDGRFEADTFYDLCDQLGLLVWQDLGSPRRADGAAGRAAHELRIRTGLARVASHPALVLLQLHDGAAADLQHLATELAPQIPLAIEPALNPADPMRRQPRFVTLLGAPAAPSTTGAGGDEPALLTQGTASELRTALDLATGLIRHRVQPEERAGLLITRGSSAPGSSLDGSGLLRQVVGRACAARQLALLGDRHGLALTMLNDHADVFAGPVLVRRLSYAGTELGRYQSDLLVWSHSAETLRLPESIAHPADPTTEVVVAEAGGLRTAWFFGDGALARPEWQLSLVPDAESVRVFATPDVLVRDACLVALGNPGIGIEGGPVTLLPGEPAEFRVLPGAGSASGLRRSLALVCRNDLSGAESSIQVPPPPGDRH